jgi:rhodanese-related sulfurtransferase
VLEKESFIGMEDMSMKKKTVYIFVLAAWLLAACSGSASQSNDLQEPVETNGKKVEVSGGSYTDISVQEMNTMLASKDFTFINVHIPFEGDIPGTDLSIPYNKIEQNLDQLPAERDAKIVLYCRSDRMSEIAARRMVELGYTNVYNLDGGFAAWEAAGLTVER